MWSGKNTKKTLGERTDVSGPEMTPCCLSLKKKKRSHMCLMLGTCKMSLVTAAASCGTEAAAAAAWF